MIRALQPLENRIHTIGEQWSPAVHVSVTSLCKFFQLADMPVIDLTNEDSSSDDEEH